MKRLLLLLVFFLSVFHGNCENANGNIDFIAPGIYQLSYPNQLINIYFNPLDHSRHQGLFVPADLSETQRYDIVKVLKQQIDLFPEEIIGAYLQIDLIPGFIFDHNTFAFSHQNQIMIDVMKTKAGMSRDESIRYVLTHETGKLILRQHSNSEATKTMKAYLNAFYLDHLHDLQNGGDIYSKGYVSIEAAGLSPYGYTVSNEMAELFAHLTCTESNQRITDFIMANPKSILKEKILKFSSYLDLIFSTIDEGELFDKSLLSEPIATRSHNIHYADQMLSIHELKSNETFDFSMANELPELEASAYSLPAEMDEPEIASYEEYYETQDFREEQIETIFDSSDDRKNKKKVKKTKKKKDGSGLLLVGSLIYLTLQLLSQ